MNLKNYKSILLCLCIFLFSTDFVLAQSVTETIARSGVETSAGTIASFSNAKLGENGDVAAWASWSPNGVQAFFTGIFRWDDQGVARIAGSGDALPTGDGVFDAFLAKTFRSTQPEALFTRQLSKPMEMAKAAFIWTPVTVNSKSFVPIKRSREPAITSMVS